MPRESYAYRVTLKEIAPADRAFAAAGSEVKRALLRKVVEWGLELKDAELAAGLDRHGEPMAKLRPLTKLHRHSEMGPADPNAPPLTPAHALSRTRSLLDGRAHDDHALFFWRVDPFGTHWGKILGYHRAGAGRLPVRDVIGLSPSSVATLRTKAAAWWAAEKHGATLAKHAETFKLLTTRTPAGPATAPPPKIALTGRTDLQNATFGIAGGKARSERAIAAGYSSGFSRLLPEAGARGAAIVHGPPPKPPAPKAPKPKAPAKPAPPPKPPGTHSESSEKGSGGKATQGRPEAVTVPPSTPVLSGAAFIRAEAERARAMGIEVVEDGAAWVLESVGTEERARGIAAGYDPHTRKIYVNEKGRYWEDPAPYMKDRGGRRVFSTDVPGHAMTHEVGHALHHQGAGTDFYMQAFDAEFDPAQAEAIASVVSRYASTKPTEFVAEVYTGLVYGRTYPEPIMRAYRALKGPTP